MEVIDQLNDHFGLYVSYVAQVGDQELLVFFSEARVEQDDDRELTFNKGTEHEVTLTGLKPIITDDRCRNYKATFRRFLIYQVLEESCIAWNNAEAFEGKLFRRFSRSRFLDHIDAHLNIDWYQHQSDMRYEHYQICGLDFIVDVATQEVPIIETVDEFPFN